MFKKVSIVISFILVIGIGLVLALSFLPEKESVKNDTTIQKDVTTPDNEDPQTSPEINKGEDEDAAVSSPNDEKQSNQVSGTENNITIEEERTRTLEIIVTALESRIEEIETDLQNNNLSEEERSILEIEKGFNEEKKSGYAGELELMQHSQ